MITADDWRKLAAAVRESADSTGRILAIDLADIFKQYGDEAEAEEKRQEEIEEDLGNVPPAGTDEYGSLE